MKRVVALGALLLLAGFAVAGPTGLLAWSENSAALKARQTEIAHLTKERDGLRNRVKLLDPAAADPDLASQLVREHLGVMREDEVVLTLDEDIRDDQEPRDEGSAGEAEPKAAPRP